MTFKGFESNSHGLGNKTLCGPELLLVTPVTCSRCRAASGGWFSEPSGNLSSLMAYIVSPLALEGLVGDCRTP